MQGQILHLPEWARTASGTPIELFRKNNARGEEPVIFIGGVHGDEPEGVRLAGDLLNWLRETDAQEIDRRSWILIPNINPDGAARGQRMNGRGVDLNRNFPSADWSTEAKAPRYYPGPSRGSEPEVQALCELLRAEKPALVVHFHSWKPCVVYTGAAGKPWAEMIAEACGYEAREDIGYPTPGSLGQYAAFDLGIPVVCVEEQEGSPLDELWPRFGPGLMKIVRGETR